MATININWPFRDVDIFIYQGTQAKVTDTFAAHALEISNWSLDEPFQMRYPELRDACKFTGYPGPDMSRINGGHNMNGNAN